MLRTAQSLPLCRALDAGRRPGPFPDRAASLLPGLLAATRTGLTPAGDDEHEQILDLHHRSPFFLAHLRVLIDKALAVGATSCCRLRHLTTVGKGWSSASPPLKGKHSWPSPDGGQGNHSMSYERSPAPGPRAREWDRPPGLGGSAPPGGLATSGQRAQ